MENPERKEIKETVNQSPIKRSNSNNRLDASTKENIEESWERKEYERQQQEIRDQRQRRYEAIGKFVTFV